MTQSEVIEKLAREWCLSIGHFSYYNNAKIYIQMALTIGIEHYTVDMEEIIVLDHQGCETDRFKGVTDAANALGLSKSGISAVLTGRQHTHGGFIFIKSKDYNLLKRLS